MSLSQGISTRACVEGANASAPLRFGSQRETADPSALPAAHDSATIFSRRRDGQQSDSATAHQTAWRSLPDIAIIGISSGAATPGRAPRPVLEQDARLGQAVANPIGLGPVLGDTGGNPRPNQVLDVVVRQPVVFSPTP
jgi:hypothetical protein